MAWPVSDIEMLAAYLGKLPAPEERIEYAIAYLTAMYANTHRGKGDPPHAVEKFLLFRNAFGETRDTKKAGRYSAADQQMLAGLASLGKKPA